ncbi:MAG: FAD-binding protein [Deltaproteobacteria bacterium]|nr:FAD-binding protein [Deltaproteobacteria bacterium]MCB9487110.1 FAD-binding protein [Deltaproteobacteria bacterium]
MTNPRLQSLVDRLGPDAVLLDPDTLAPYAKDNKTSGLAPIAVVRPASTEDVQATVEFCHERKIALIARGAGSGTVGGAVPEREAVVLDLCRMTEVLWLDEMSMTVAAQAGMITEDLQRHVAKFGLSYPPDPASADRSTIGGNAATNAGGLRAVKYGVTGDYVLGLTVVLADGRVMKTGVQTRKGVVGYDLTHLFVGSEGTLGIITELTLRLVRAPETARTLVASFDDLESCARGVQAILASPVLPAAIELVDEQCVRAIQEAGAGQVAFQAPFLLVEVDGRAAVVDEELAILDEALRATGAVTRVASDEAQTKALWDGRRAISESLKKVSPAKVSEDITVPIAKLVELLRGVSEIAKPKGLTHLAYGHAGDGNLHVNVLFDPAVEGVRERVEAFRGELFDLTLRLGGTMSGEHGVGIAKRPFIDRELSPVSLEMHRRIKAALDPDNLLNPGKIWPAPMGDSA